MTSISIATATTNLADAQGVYDAASLAFRASLSARTRADIWKLKIERALRPNLVSDALETAVVDGITVTSADLKLARAALSKATRARTKAMAASTAAGKALASAKVEFARAEASRQPTEQEVEFELSRCRRDHVGVAHNEVEVSDFDLMRSLDSCVSQITGLGHVPVADHGSRVAYIIMDEVFANDDRPPVTQSVARDAAVRLHDNDPDRRGDENLARYILQSAACIARGDKVADACAVRWMLALCLYTPSAMRAYGPEWGHDNRYEDVRHIVLDLVELAGFILWSAANPDEVAYIKDNPTNHHNMGITEGITDPELMTLRSLAAIVEWLAPSTPSDCSAFREAA